ncbi:MAG: hypothetical protein GY733_22795 [bacterium]|nr:hypothetical protein [bacterium]
MEAQQDGGAPAWLFSFVDLAFLMLIAMTQLAGDVGADAPDLGEIVVPRIGEQGAPGELAAGAKKVWQLRIYPPADRDAVEQPEGPYALILGGETAEQIVRADLPALREQVATLFRDGVKKPLLAPHEDSRSQDLLNAVALLEEHWPTRRRALVARIAEL